MILLATDDVHLQQVVLLGLARIGRIGHTVSTAADVETALRFYNYELILLQLALGTLPSILLESTSILVGAKVASTIRENEVMFNKTRTPIIGVYEVLTALDQLSLQYGIDELIDTQTLLNVDPSIWLTGLCERFSVS